MVSGDSFVRTSDVPATLLCARQYFLLFFLLRSLNTNKKGVSCLQVVCVGFSLFSHPDPNILASLDRPVQFLFGHGICVYSYQKLLRFVVGCSRSLLFLLLPGIFGGL